MTINPIIEKIKIKNFKKFKDDNVIYFNEGINIIIGDNEAGKSTLLLAIDLITSGSKNRVYSLGLENLFNVDCINEFMKGNKEYKDLPKLIIELYFKGDVSSELEGNNNEENKILCGIRMEIIPDKDYSDQIIDNLKNGNTVFPFEYYKCIFKTFSGKTYDSMRKFVNSLFVNSSTISADNSLKQYVSNMYSSNIDDVTKNKLNNEFRNLKNSFENKKLANLLSQVDNNLAFKLSKENKYSLENNLSLSYKDIDLINKGDGYKCKLKVETFIKNNSNNVNYLLIEEPENHLSTTNMKKLINEIGNKYCNSENNKQMFITTHNSYICSRLGLKSIISLNENNKTAFKLKQLNDDTSKFFIKCPSDSILQFILSNKVILVEGAAEYILLEKFYEIINGNSPSQDGVIIISINGLSFLRYLEVAKIIENKVAIITDNDHDYEEKIEKKYSNFSKISNIKVFSDKNNDNFTFEVCIVNDNFEILKRFISKREIEDKNRLMEYMMNDKAESAYKILDWLETNDDTSIFKIPDYIKGAIEWIKD